jgi:hypothetical protein
MKHLQTLRVGSCGLAFCFTLTTSSWSQPVVDEAKAAEKAPAAFPKVTADVFKPMDRRAIVGELSEEVIRGRNTWNLWTAGNQHLWAGVALDEPTESGPQGIDEQMYGKPTGVLGFRLFPNPDFKEAARKNGTASAL